MHIVLTTSDLLFIIYKYSIANDFYLDITNKASLLYRMMWKGEYEKKKSEEDTDGDQSRSLKVS